MPRPKGSKNKKGRLFLKEFICPICQNKFYRYRNSVYCSHRCKGISQSEKYKGKGNPFYGKSFKHTKETKIRIGIAVIKRFDKIGRKQHKEYRHPNTIRKYREWREKVFKRDNYTCQDCGARSKKGKKVYLEAHHKKSWTKFPKLRFRVKNGKTLCKKCHKKYKKKLCHTPTR